MSDPSIPSEDQAAAEQQQFIAANAEYFAQSLSSLNALFDNAGNMNIVSEEDEYTVILGMKTIADSEDVDVDCAILEPKQESLQGCIDALFS